MLPFVTDLFNLL